LALKLRLWAAADALRNNMDAAEYKHVVLGLILVEAKAAALEEQKRSGRQAWACM
jgi:type I restriction enzyme M protein